MSKKDKLLSRVRENIEDGEVTYETPREMLGLPADAEKSRSEIDGTKRIRNAREIPVGMIRPDPDQPRKTFDADALGELADSIREHGILQPITVEYVEEDGAGYYKIISGERRYQAAKTAGLEMIPCLTHSDVSSADRFARQLIENLQREDLSPIEKAMSLVDYKNRLGEDAVWADVERKIGLSDRRRKQFVSLLNLPENIQREIVVTGRRPAQNQITEKHARALLMLNDQPEKQLDFFNSLKQSETSISGDEAIEKARELKGKKTLLRFSVTYETDLDLLKILQAKIKEIKDTMKVEQGGT